jgi:hypothetical protein
MKYPNILAGSALLMAVVLPATSQTLPGGPETNGLSPKTATIYVNTTNTINNGNTESLGIGMASNGNVMVGWEDDADIDPSMPYIGSGWMMFSSTGALLTSSNKITSVALGETLTNNILSFYRPDGSVTPALLGWGPKIKGNLFGNGIGHGASGGGDALIAEVPGFETWTAGSGDVPIVQLFDNNAAPISPILTGASAAYAGADTGSIRIGDWDYLSNGNIVIAGDSRQSADYMNLYGSAFAVQHQIYRVVTPTGAVVKPEALVSALTNYTGNQNIWHGVGVTANGFAIRFPAPEGICVRMFDNSGNGLTTNLPLSALTGYAQAGGGGRGDGVGFGGNGKDAYVHACDYSLNGTNGWWVTVLNADGTVRWSRDVADDLILTSVERGDAAINENGEVVVVFTAGIDAMKVAVGRLFDATGKPMGGTFFISEKEVPDPNNPPLAVSQRPRVAWRNGILAVAWESKNDPDNIGVNEVALRVFSTVPPSLSISLVGTSVKISWPTDVTGYQLQSTGTLATSAIWNPVGGVVNNSVTISNPTGAQFYRLKKL